MQKYINGQYINMTAEEIAAMEAELSRGSSEQEKQAFLKTLQKINQNLGGTACPEKE